MKFLSTVVAALLLAGGTWHTAQASPDTVAAGDERAVGELNARRSDAPAKAWGCKRRVGSPEKWVLHGEVNLAPILSVVRHFGACANRTPGLRVNVTEGLGLNWTPGPGKGWRYEGQNTLAEEDNFLPGLTFRLNF